MTGLAVETPFARDALARLGVKPRMSKRHEYKAAVNTYLEQTYTQPHREETERFLASLFGQMVRGVAEGRGLSEEQVKEAVDAAPLQGPAGDHGRLGGGDGDPLGEALPLAGELVGGMGGAGEDVGGADAVLAGREVLQVEIGFARPVLAQFVDRGRLLDRCGGHADRCDVMG